MYEYEYEVFRTKEDVDKGSSVLQTESEEEAQMMARKISGIVTMTARWVEITDWRQIWDDYTNKDEEEDEPAQ